MKFIQRVAKSAAVVGLIGGFFATVTAQIPTSTPAPVRILSPTPPQPIQQDDGAVNDETEFDVSGVTATPRGLTIVRPLSDVTARSSPEILDDNQVGTISPGERYNVLGRYFNWIEIQYDPAPNQRAWVYRDVVEIDGNIEAIPTVILNPTNTPDPAIDAETATMSALLAQSDGPATATALARVVQLPDQNVDSDADTGDRVIIPVQTALPTFTYPPNVAVGVPTLAITRAVNFDRATDTNQGVAPILPILFFGGLGLLGIIASLLRGL